jgi:hypothetical protein
MYVEALIGSHNLLLPLLDFVGVGLLPEHSPAQRFARLLFQERRNTLENPVIGVRLVS